MQFEGTRNLRSVAVAIFVFTFVLAWASSAHAQIIPTAGSVDFGDQFVGTQSPSPMLAQFVNTDPQNTYNVVNVSWSESQFSCSVSGSESMAPGGVLNVWIWFTPSSAQFYSGTLTVTTDAGISVQANISGNGVSTRRSRMPVQKGTLSVSSSSFSFGTVGVGGSGSQGVVISNSGAANVTISDVSVAGPGLSVFGLSSGQVLSPGQNVGAFLTLAPAVAGITAGTVTISSDAANPQLTISFTGAAVGGAASSSVSLNWNPSASSDITGYNVYRSSISGGYYLLLGSAGNSTNFIDNGVLSGLTYYYVVTAVNSGNAESAYSSEVAAAMP